MGEGTPAAAAPSELEERPLDRDSQAWLAALRSEGAAREAAVVRLHALLLRAARFEVRRRRDALPHTRADELGDLALQAADDALMAVLAHLGDFRGLSRFTTWAYKFALLEAAVKLRRRAWQSREIPLEAETWSLVPAAGASPEEQAEEAELLDGVRNAIATALTPHQRRVLTAVALNGVPIDVLAERLGTTRGALYKTLHDARKRLRGHLRSAGLSSSLTGESA